MPIVWYQFQFWSALSFLWGIDWSCLSSCHAFRKPPKLVWFGLSVLHLPPAHHHAAASQSQHQVSSGTSSSCGKQTEFSDVTRRDVSRRWLQKSPGWLPSWEMGRKVSIKGGLVTGGGLWGAFTPRLAGSCPCCAEDSSRQSRPSLAQSRSESSHLRLSPNNRGSSSPPSQQQQQ